MTRSVTSPLRYPGGKQRLTKQIAEHLPKEEFTEYREPFVGGGSVFFHIRKLGKGQVFWLNDLFEPVANFWQQVMSNPQELIKYVNIFRTDTPKGSELFEDMKKFYDDCPRDGGYEPDLAAAFFIVNRLSFSGLGFSGGFSQASFDGRFKDSHINMIQRCSELMDNCKITNLDYSVLLEASPQSPEHNVFIFLDPPYDIESSNLYGNRGDTHKTFDHAKFAQDCEKCKHKWLITYNDNPGIRDLFKGFARITEVPVTYNMNSKNKKTVELFITNY